jgi:hypothetical protein
MLHILSLRRDVTSCPEAEKKWSQFCSFYALSPDACAHERVWEVVKSLVDPDVTNDDVSMCLRKEAANSFGIMAPVGEGVRSLCSFSCYE